MIKTFFSNLSKFFFRDIEKKRRIKWWHWLLMLILYAVCVVAIWYQKEGFEELRDVLMSILSTLIGLFITALVFAIEGLPVGQRKRHGLFDIEIRNNGEVQQKKIYYQEKHHKTSEDQIRGDKLYYYASSIQYAITFNIILALVALFCLLVDALCANIFSLTDITKYIQAFWDTCDLKCLLKGGVPVLMRAFIIFDMLIIILNTLYVIIVLMQFSDVKRQIASEE